ncbi:hypothetical protein SK128_005364 [Halocaridina rubra]|uniref:Peptidase M14 domain-containing protein n=1 Tax=Halocaridina rubra TaxID=373956 RepID=A0AAN8XCA2_HALRR
MTRLLWLVELLLAIVASNVSASNYRELVGHQIWKLDSRMKSKMPSQMMSEGLLDILDHSGPSNQVRVMPKHVETVNKIFKNEGITYEVIIDDLAAYFESEELKDRARRDVTEEQEACTESRCTKPLKTQYMTFQQMEWYLQNLNDSQHRKIDISSIGKSHENRDIWLVHIKSDNASARSVWVEGGLHAREWISPAVAFGLIDNILNNEEMTSNFDFFIAPMVNPDGYEYSWTNDRMWRKNRRDNEGRCDGVDLNRNWDFHFGVGASSYPCSETYMGPSAFSEPETQALRDAMTNRKDNLTLILSLHSYGQDLLYPWGWSHLVAAPNKEELIAAGNIFADGAKRDGGHTYSVINSAGGMYYASGATDDWALGVLKTKYVYTLELRDDGKRGFTLSTEDIDPCLKEVWNGLRKLLEHIA